MSPIRITLRAPIVSSVHASRRGSGRPSAAPHTPKIAATDAKSGAGRPACDGSSRELSSPRSGPDFSRSSRTIPSAVARLVPWHPMAARRAPRRERRRARGFLLTVQRIRSGRGTERDRREGSFRRMAFEHRTPKRRSSPFELRRPVSPGHGLARPPWTSAGPRFLLGHGTHSSVWRRARAVSSSCPHLTLPVAREEPPDPRPNARPWTRGNFVRWPGRVVRASVRRPVRRSFRHGKMFNRAPRARF